jgi:hypothetical protein
VVALTNEESRLTLIVTRALLGADACSGATSAKAARRLLPAEPPRVLPPIRTFTVGPGVSPGPPAAGYGRVADCHRRFGVSPTPEHAVARASSVARNHGSSEAHRQDQIAFGGVATPFHDHERISGLETRRSFMIMKTPRAARGAAEETARCREKSELQTRPGAPPPRTTSFTWQAGGRNARRLVQASRRLWNRSHFTELYGADRIR